MGSPLKMGFPPKQDSMYERDFEKEVSPRWISPRMYNKVRFLDWKVSSRRLVKGTTYLAFDEKCFTFHT